MRAYAAYLEMSQALLIRLTCLAVSGILTHCQPTVACHSLQGRAFLTSLAESVMANPRVIKQFVKFAIVGAIGTMIDVGLLFVLHEKVGLNLYVSNAISFSAAVLNNYTWNSLWTFGDQDKQHGRQIVQFLIVSVVGLVLSSLLLALFHDGLGLYYLIAKLLSIVIVLFWNFTANRFWTFRES